MASSAVLLAPPHGTLADATSLKAALGVVPVMLVLAAAGLTLVRRARTRPSGSARNSGRAAFSVAQLRSAHAAGLQAQPLAS